ncbi:E3 ubiquitin-protein ligase TRIM7-like isoform X2 [Elgaria multicarinata webbii]|uniref:E3 ubiquitin-protein ligase TRIM7-like isoform X2 n=1 Tax=Elgaria multicarinata webbii TaxID=159646 RepID=UPI002FCD23D2
MAAQNYVKNLQDEAICSICLEYFKEPVTLPCGHNFCQPCIAQHLAKSETTMACPQCRETTHQRNFQPNKQLAKLVEIVKQMEADQAGTTRGETMCERHQEALKVFCEEDQAPICLVCHLSQEHRGHSCFPIDEASRDYLQRINTEKQKVLAAFQHLKHFLEEQEGLLLAQLEQLKETSVTIRDEYLGKFSDEVTRLSTLIAEVENKCQQPASEFLQGIRITLSRCEEKTFQKATDIAPELEKSLNKISKKITVLTTTLKKCKGILSKELKKEEKDTFLDAYQTVNVTLDVETANPFLILSADLKSVRLGTEEQVLPITPKRFLSDYCVLGKEGFISEKVTFVVNVGHSSGWAIGLARESVKRKPRVNFKIEEGIWGLYCARGEYQTLTLPCTKLSLPWKPKKIRALLDYEGGEVVFCDEENSNEIYHFKASFTEKIFPFCWIPGLHAELRFCS